ncbi:EB domain-containing protein [Trichonephila clavipes]|uniref:EB domain-containing protein n=1 Tax=Trichonephila clavipes TaxID=2585209 RepID=A0A8X6SRH7_TRICX|nr:EB domain-containing protein [Trichonephila clavipes]
MFPETLLLNLCLVVWQPLSKPEEAQLVTRARFRNHRTIFNSPHPRLMHIKLGKKKGRRRASHTSLEVPGSRQLSICSQLSPLQSRREPFVGNWQFGQDKSIKK